MATPCVSRLSERVPVWPSFVGLGRVLGPKVEGGVTTRLCRRNVRSEDKGATYSVTIAVYSELSISGSGIQYVL